MSQETTVASASVPATAANLGPAFDVLALALQPRCTVTAQAAETWSVEHVGEFSPDGKGDGVLAAARLAVGDDRPLALKVDTAIPMERGLGSSAAAFVSGTAAALRAVGEVASPDRVFRLAASLEGHPDQVAASIYGGLVLIPAEGQPIRLPLHPRLRPVMAVPETRQPTAEARSIIDREHPHDRVLRSLSRVSALTAGLVTGDAEMLAAAHGDEIHEGPRAALSPEVGQLMDIGRRAGALHVGRSGAGPSVIAIATVDTADQVAAAFEAQGVMVINAPAATTGLI